MNRHSVTLLVLVFLFGCGHSVAPRERTLQALRERVARVPEDATAARDRALAELVAPGGDPAAGGRALATLPARWQMDPRVRFARGLLAVQHGDFDAGLAELVAAVDGARRTPDPLGPAIAEAAVPRILALRADVDDFQTPFQALVERALQEPGFLGAAAYGALLESAVRWARERGLRDEARRWTEASGCVTTWTVAGPFGPFPMLRFDETLPPEGPSPWRAAYDLGPGRGMRPTYTLQARGCAANLGRGSTLTGVLIAATDVVLPRATEAVLRVESPNTFSVAVDGVVVARVDARREITGSQVLVPLHLEAGRHTLRVKVASRFHSPLLIAQLTDPRGVPVGRFVPAAEGAHPVPPRWTAGEVPWQSPATEPFTRYVWAELAFSRRDPAAARELLRPLAADEHATAMTLLAFGAVAQADPSLPADRARDRARRAFERAGRQDPEAWLAPLQLARLAREDERADEALTLLREASGRFPDNPELAVDLAERLLDRSWEGEARTLLERFHQRLPRACWPTRMLLSLAQRRSTGADELPLARALRDCDALSDALVGVLVRTRAWGAAQDEYQRLLGDDPEARGLRRSLVELARLSLPRAEALRRGEALLGELPEDDGLRADLVDLLLEGGRGPEALALLDRELARGPSELWSLYRLRAVLARREDVQPWRLDGPAELRAFEASGREYDASAVLVLDYTVRRNYRDGSALELTHNVVRVQSQEGVEAHGEFTPPEGAVVLRMRTLKADGRRLEPEVVAGKDSVSFPELRPGDAIEFEYVRALPPTDLAPGGYVGDRFYFQGFEVPYHRSELVVVAPRGMDVVVDPRGPAPEHQRTDRGALVEHRWVATQSDRRTPEPSSVAAREFIPSVCTGAGATWERLVDALRDRLIDQDPRDPEAVAEVSALVRGARTPTERLARLHRWVLDNIQQEGSGTPFDLAPRMLAARAGHRTRVLCYMLNLAGVPCQLALLRPGNADATESPLADDDTYQSILLQVETETGMRWVTAADHNAPLAYLPPAVAGASGMLLAPGAPRVTAPPLDAEAHGRTLSVRLQLLPDGSGRGEVEERLRGYAATGAREALRRMDEANRARQFEAYVGSMIAGVSVEGFTVTGITDREEDIVFRYRFTAPGMADLAGSRMTFDGIFHADAAGNYAESPMRSVPLWNGDPVRAILDLHLAFPEGATVDAPPASSEGEGPGVRWSVRWEREGSGLHLTRRVEIPTGRVQVRDYPTFSEVVRALDTADTLRVEVRLSGR